MTCSARTSCPWTPSAGRYVVTVSGPGRAYHTEPEADASDAYARALLYVLGANGTDQPAQAVAQAR